MIQVNLYDKTLGVTKGTIKSYLKALVRHNFVVEKNCKIMITKAGKDWLYMHA